MTFPSSLKHPPPTAPPSQLPFKHMSPAAEISSDEFTTSSSSVSLNLSLLIIFAIIAFVFATSASIHLLLRLLSSRRRSSVAAAPPLPPPALHQSSSDSSSSPAAAAPDSGLSEKDKAVLVESLPLFSLASALASLPRSSPDCAVCLYSFRPHDELRLLPACRHAFHSQCVDPWLRSTPSCPLCRISITVPAPLQLPPPPEAAAANGDAPRPGSFRVEIGSVSRRRAQLEMEPAANPPSHLRTFSLGSSFEYVVDDEVEAVVSGMRRLTEKEEKREVLVVACSAVEPAPAPPGAEVVEAVGGGGRGWLREHVDRLASSASSSFSSLRFSGRWSHRYDGGAGGGRHSWDLEGNARQEAEEGGYYGFYRWLIGV